jgi:protoporphyrinogen oxidase
MENREKRFYILEESMMRFFEERAYERLMRRNNIRNKYIYKHEITYKFPLIIFIIQFKYKSPQTPSIPSPFYYPQKYTLKSLS